MSKSTIYVYYVDSAFCFKVWALCQIGLVAQIKEVRQLLAA